MNLLFPPDYFHLSERELRIEIQLLGILSVLPAGETIDMDDLMNWGLGYPSQDLSSRGFLAGNGLIVSEYCRYSITPKGRIYLYLMKKQ